MIERAWGDFVNCQDDQYFGNKTKRAHQLAVLRRFADSIKIEGKKNAFKIRQKPKDNFK